MYSYSYKKTAIEGKQVGIVYSPHIEHTDDDQRLYSRVATRSRHVSCRVLPVPFRNATSAAPGAGVAAGVLVSAGAGVLGVVLGPHSCAVALWARSGGSPSAMHTAANTICKGILGQYI